MEVVHSTESARQLFHEGCLALAEVEHHGLRVDVERLDRAMKDVDAGMVELAEQLKQDEIWKRWKRRYGQKASLGSRMQLSTILFKEMGYEAEGHTRLTTRSSMDKNVLERIDIPFVHTYLELEQLKKLRGTYLLGLKKEVVDGFVHPSFNLHMVRTFRSCIAKGTSIEVVRNVKRYPKGIPIENVRVGDFVYCYDDDLNLVLRKVLWAGKTGCREVVRLHWSARGKKGHLDLTPEHRVRLVDGTYVRAVDLVGDFRSKHTSKHSPRVHVLALGRVKDALFVTGKCKAVHDHRFVHEQLVGPVRKSDVVHHRDRNHFNNKPKNLRAMTKSKHAKLHKPEHLTPEAQRRGAETTRRRYANGELRRDCGKDTPNWIELSKFTLLRMIAMAKGRPTRVKMDFESFKRKAQMLGIDLSVVRDRYTVAGKYISVGRLRSTCRTGRICDVTHTFHINYGKAERLLRSRGLAFEYVRENRNPWGRKGKPSVIVNNHAITQVELLHRKVDVYDLEVEGEHNFIANEICVHNSADSPNIQNQIKRNEGHARILRECFIPRDGHVLVECDFSALEFKIAACIWRDKAQIEYASNPELDIHRDMAMECYLLTKKQVTKRARFFAKNQFVFPILYGSYYVSCARSLWDVIETAKLETSDGIPLAKHLRSAGIKRLGDLDSKVRPAAGTFEEHVQEVERSFNRRFPEWSRRKEEWLKRYHERGWFRTVTGFVCSGIYSRNELYNYPVQGPAFHCLLWSLIQMVKWLRKKKMRSVIVAQIHDSMVCDVHRDELDEFLVKVRQVMTEDIRKHWAWVVTPLGIEVEMSEKNWAEMKPVEI